MSRWIPVTVHTDRDHASTIPRNPRGAQEVSSVIRGLREDGSPSTKPRGGRSTGLIPEQGRRRLFFLFFSPDRSIVHLFLGFLLLFRGHRLFDFDQVFRCRRITNPLSVVFNTNDSCSNRSGKNEASDANQQPRGGSRARFETGRSFGEMNCGNSWLAPRIIFDLCSRWFSLFLVGTIYRWTGNFNEDLSKPRWDEHRCKCYNVQF